MLECRNFKLNLSFYYVTRYPWISLKLFQQENVGKMICNTICTHYEKNIYLLKAGTSEIELTNDAMGNVDFLEIS